MKIARIALLAATLATPSMLLAGFCSSSAPDEPRHEFQFFGGYSPSSAVLVDGEADRRFVAAGFSYSYRCWLLGSTSLNLTSTLMPAAIVLQPDQTGPNGTIPGHAVYGFAVAPLGLTAEFAHKRKVHPFFETMEGMIASLEPIPIDQTNGTGLNFIFDVGGGMRWKVRPRGELSFGYKFLHISNANTTNFNPGLNNNLIYVGYSFLR